MILKNLDELARDLLSLILLNLYIRHVGIQEGSSDSRSAYSGQVKEIFFVRN